MQFLIVLAATIGMAVAQSVIPGQCQNVSVVQDFDIPAYGDLWYEIYRYEHENEPDGECVTAEYTLNSFGNVTVVNSMVVNNILFTIEGTAAPASDNGEGKLIVHFPIGADNIYNNYWVLSTDYTNYSLVYVCTNLPNNEKRISSWILSRSKTLSPQSILAMNGALQAADGLNWETYKETDHAESVCRVNRVQ